MLEVIIARAGLHRKDVVCEMEISEDDSLTCPVSIPAVAGDWPHNQLVNLRHDDASHTQ